MVEEGEGEFFQVRKNKHTKKPKDETPEDDDDDDADDHTAHKKKN
jgi:hypothetical protein